MAVKGFQSWPSTGAGVMASTIAPTAPVSLVAVKLHLDAAGGTAENFTITIDSARGVEYDCLLFSQDMETVTDVLWVLEEPLPILDGDELELAYANTNSRTWGLEVITQREDY